MVFRLKCVIDKLHKRPTFNKIIIICADSITTSGQYLDMCALLLLLLLFRAENNANDAKTFLNILATVNFISAPHVRSADSITSEAVTHRLSRDTR